MIHFIGYHGTSFENAMKILESRFYHSKAEHWLGQGVYFYDNSSSAFKYDNAVIRADIYVRENELLDCFSPNGKQSLAQKQKNIIYRLRKVLMTDYKGLCQ